tara:strand:- start:1327 stop:1590 length:264 start_codon:yes stop_codon:yes gene_type:complete
MANGLNANSQIHISIALLIKAGILIAIVTGSWYQAQMKFAEQQRRIEDLENKLTVLTASVEGMETQHIQDLEETNRSLMQRLGLRKP